MNLTKAGLRRIESYNLILKACTDKIVNVADLSKLADLSVVYTAKHCKMLMNRGYLSMQIKLMGPFKSKTFYYSTLIPEFSLNDSARGDISIVKAVMPLRVKAETMPLRPCERRIEERHPYREVRKSQRAWVSGSSLSAAV